MNQPNFTASSNDCARAIVAIVEKVTGQSLPMETCSRIVACVSIELKHSHALLVDQNERMRQAIARAIEMHLGRCASSEPFTAVDYRNHACDAREILRAALNPPPTK